MSECLSGSLVSRMTSSCSNNGFTALSHGANEVINVSDDQCIPCSLQSHTQLPQSKWMGFELLDTSPHHVADVLYLVQVRRPRWPLHTLNSMALKELGHNLARWGRALSSIKMKFSPTFSANGTTIGSRTSSLYLTSVIALPGTT